jgi:hypothetical protein
MSVPTGTVEKSVTRELAAIICPDSWFYVQVDWFVNIDDISLLIGHRRVTFEITRLKAILYGAAMYRPRGGCFQMVAMIRRSISGVSTAKTVAGVKGCSWRAATNGRYRTANGLPRTLV